MRPPLAFRSRSRQGAFALILVLITLTLATVIVIFYLASIGRERNAVDLYSQQSRVRQLADLPVSIVQAQINAATKEGTLKNPISWASQPGMIRTYDVTGSLSHAYKLYSWDTIAEGAGFDPVASSQLPPQSWEASPALFTDLNQPVNKIYPIADPATANFPSGSAEPASNVPWDFTSEFFVDNGATSYSKAKGRPAVANSQSVPNSLPMPVKWVYTLQDGTWAAPTNSSGATPTFPTAVTPSATNPIVGRIAFWTDDETSKVNVNTASEGAYWDWPKSATKDEMQLAANPPASGEFQRISGHPSTTSLSAVLPELRTSAAYNRWNAGLANTDYLNSLTMIYDMLPRVGGGSAAKSSGFFGSLGGTFPGGYNLSYPPDVTSFQTTLSPPTAYQTANKYAPVAISPLRLYATSDDFWYKPGSTTHTSSSSFRDGNTGLVNTSAFSGTTGDDPTKLRQRLFFLTANSRAPETTLFETPRISLWPITYPYPAAYYYNPTTSTSTHGSIPNPSVSGFPDPNASGDTLQQLINWTNSNGTKNITAQEQLLAFDSTLNKYINGNPGSATEPSPYYFQRQSSDSPTKDWTIRRNRQLINYLRYYVGRDTPGFGSNLASKWDLASQGNTDWIALNILNYSRSMVNQYVINPNPETTAQAGSLQYAYTGIAVRKGSIQKAPGTGSTSFGGVADYTEQNSFTAAPLRVIPNRTGGSDTPNLTTSNPIVTSSGAYPSLKEVAVMFFATERRIPSYTGKDKQHSAVVPEGKANPFLWENLICPPRSPQPYGSSTGAGFLIGVDTTPGLQDNYLDRDEGASATTRGYPANIQTTKMKAVVFFRFSGLRTTAPYGASGIPFNPTFWIKVDGLSFRVDNGAGTTLEIGLPKGGSRSVKYNAHSTINDGPANNPTFATLWREDKPGIPKRFDNTITAPYLWSLVSDDIPVNGDKRVPQFFFNFVGTPLTIGVYATLPYDPIAGTNPNTDPTSRPEQLVAEYNVDFSKWNSALPIPTAPYWTARTQANDPAGVPNNYPLSGNPLGQYWVGADIVPSSITPAPTATTAQFSTQTRSGSPFPATGVVIGTTTATPTGTTGVTLDGTKTDATETSSTAGTAGCSWSRNWVPYAYKAVASAGDRLGIAANGGMDMVTKYTPPTLNSMPGTEITAYPALTPFSTQMENRVASLAYYFNDPVSNSALFGFGGSQQGTYAWICPSMITPYDTVISMISDPLQPNGGDPRLTLLGRGTGALSIDQNVFVKSSDVFLGAHVSKNTAGATSSIAMESSPGMLPSTVFSPQLYPRFTAAAQYHQLGAPSTLNMPTGYQLQPKLFTPAIVNDPYVGSYTFLGIQGSYFGWNAPVWDQNYIGIETNALMVLNRNWDWTSQPGNSPDGGYIARADQDYQTLAQDIGTNVTNLLVPYFSKASLTMFSTASNSGGASVASTPNFFSPNRQIPSPIVLGTIPSSMAKGWQTLCFSPNPALGSAHPGLGSSQSPPSVAGKPYTNAVPDHLLLDFFWMPVAEPYPVSEQFSTAGKINLNYAMMPFPYIKRKTGLDAVLKNVWIYALENTSVSHTGVINPMSWDYKSTNGLASDTTRSRFPIQVENTLKAFDYKFERGDIFRSASQLCDMFLYPADPTNPTTAAPPVVSDSPPSTSGIEAWWARQVLTSDNGREEPYNAIYSRVTTKSNTFTVHWKVQSLRKINNTDQASWAEGRDQVVSELRGSTLIERYLDPNANNIPDYAKLAPSDFPNDNVSGAQPMSYYYKWRVGTANYFQP